jgi:hypothetical protein
MGFTIPTNDPGAATYATPPNVIRASTVLNLVQQDRFTLATSSRLVASCSRIVKSSALVLVYVGQFKTSAYATGKVWVCASGSNAVVNVLVNGAPVSFTLAAPFTSDNALLVAGLAPSTTYQFAVSLGPIAVGSHTLNGLYIVEERLQTLP